MTLVFLISFDVHPDLSDDEIDGLTERFVAEAIEAQGLLFGGGGYRCWQGCISRRHRSVSGRDRRGVVSWLQANAAVLRGYRVTKLIEDGPDVDPLETSRRYVGRFPPARREGLRWRRRRPQSQHAAQLAHAAERAQRDRSVYP